MYIFVLFSSSPLLFAQRMAFEAIRASSFSFARRQVEQAVEFSGAHSLDKKFYIPAVATPSRSGRSVSGRLKVQARYWNARLAHIAYHWEFCGP